MFKRKKGVCLNSNVDIDKFYEHFKSLTSARPPDGNDNILYATNDHPANDEHSFAELELAISDTEIEKAILRLKRNKSHGPDCILNEYFIEYKDLLIPLLNKLFNRVLDTGHYPTSWSQAVIVPIHKKGDSLDPNNYRGISLLSCLGKLFTSIINQRLLTWSEGSDIISDAQFGFKRGVSTADAIFALHTIISKTFASSKRLYCAFVDFRKAFDYVDRVKLWFKLSKCGMRGKMLTIIKSLYLNVKSCVTINGALSQSFVNNCGLMQGEVLSPVLFSLYLNDLELAFVESNCKPVEVKSLSLFLLMYADDLVLLSESAAGLQTQIDSLYTYCNQWGLEVNTEKTKILVFRKAGRVKHSFFYNDIKLDNVDKFAYLGVNLNYNNKFNVTEKTLSEQGRKACLALYSNTKGHCLNQETRLSLFDCYVNSILSYASEVWGANKGLNIEKVHLEYCRQLLGVKKSTNKVMIYSELGIYPLQYIRTYNIIKYWCKLLKTDNTILKCCYEYQFECAENDVEHTWAYFVKKTLFNLGFNDVWSNQELDESMLPIIKQRILDQYVQLSRCEMDASVKCTTYKYLIDNHCIQYYLCKPLTQSVKKIIAQFRMSSHQLAIETGRYHGIDRNQRICVACKLYIEDEFHFILKCPLYNDLRNKFIKPYYYRRPSVFKLVQLLSTKSVKELCHLGNYLKKALLIRNTFL
jgi:hypothetical protein